MSRWTGAASRPGLGTLRAFMLATLLVGCAGLGAGTGVVGPPREPGRALSTWVSERTQPRRYALNLRNDSDAVVRVTAVILRGCENVRESCDRHPVDVALQPGDHARLLTIHPRNAAQAVYFDWGYDTTFFDR